MTEELEKLPCPQCGSSKTPALQPYLEDGKLSGYCFACETRFKDPYKGIVGGGYVAADGSELTAEQLSSGRSGFEDDDSAEEDWGDADSKESKMSEEELKKGLVEHTEDYRGLRPSTYKKFGVMCKLSPTGEVLKQYYPYGQTLGSLSAYKERDCKKKGFFIKGDGKKVKMFGLDKVKQGPKKTIIITEGELDALAVYQIMQDRAKPVNVVSSFSATTRTIKDSWEELNEFETIIVLFDGDEAGDKAAHKIPPLFEPGKVKLARLPEEYKDANELLLDENADHGGILAATFRNAVTERPEGIKSVEDLYEEAMLPRDVGLDYPWDGVTEMTGGIRKGELITITAGSGSGKTVFSREVLHHLAIKHNKKVGFLFLEERAAKTLKTLAGMESGVQYHKMSEIEDKDQFRKDMSKFKDKAFFYDSFGSNSWDLVKDKIRYFVQGLGVEYLAVDNLTALTAHETDEYGSLNAIMAEIAGIVTEQQVNIQLISHLRKSAGGKAFEEGAQVSSSDLRGSSAINFWSFQILAVERDTQHEEEDVRNTSTIRMLKDRVDGRVGETASLFYNKTTGRWVETEALPEEDF